jgi:hypothetical protein
MRFALAKDSALLFYSCTALDQYIMHQHLHAGPESIQSIGGREKLRALKPTPERRNPWHERKTRRPCKSAQRFAHMHLGAMHFSSVCLYLLNRGAPHCILTRRGCIWTHAKYKAIKITPYLQILLLNSN